jgi:hypothetical protein
MNQNIGTSIYGHASGGSPLFRQRDPGLFAVWRQWLKDLDGTYEPVRNLDETKPLTGRRDKDRQPRQYELGEKYGVKSNGQVIRL